LFSLVVGGIDSELVIVRDVQWQIPLPVMKINPILHQQHDVAEAQL